MTPGIINAAITNAQQSTFPRHKVAAIIFDKKRILAAGTNAKRFTHRLKPRYKRFNNSFHAEQAAILNARRDLKGKSMLVLRITAGGNFGLAKPCDLCMSFIEYVGIKNLYYTDENGGIAYERLHNN